MREVADASRVRAFMGALAARAETQARVYFTGGATAVLIGWRPTTIDVDIKIVPESDRLLQAIPELKEALHINVELAAPDQFIPPLEGWQERSPFINQEGHLAFHHYDLYAQALAKIERGHRQDLEDVRQMFQRGLVEAKGILRHYETIESHLYRYPAMDPKSFRAAVERMCRDH